MSNGLYSVNQPQEAKRKRGSAQPQDAKRKRGSAQPQEWSEDQWQIQFRFANPLRFSIK
jgi:hypothetical protein